MQNIIGISLGTRLLGIAIVYDGTLYDFRVRTFYGSWNETKRSKIIAAIRKAIEQYAITALVIKIPRPKHRSLRIQELQDDIRQLSEQLGIKLTICTINCLRDRYNGNTRPNKRVLVESIISKYPQHRQLAKLNVREHNSRRAYHIKIFEAIACVERELRTEQ